MNIDSKFRQTYLAYLNQQSINTTASVCTRFVRLCEHYLWQNTY